MDLEEGEAMSLTVVEDISQNQKIVSLTVVEGISHIVVISQTQKEVMEE